MHVSCFMPAMSDVVQGLQHTCTLPLVYLLLHVHVAKCSIFFKFMFSCLFVNVMYTVIDCQGIKCNCIEVFTSIGLCIHHTTRTSYKIGSDLNDIELYVIFKQMFCAKVDYL